MQKLAIIIINLMVSTVAFASWYWPFGGEEATDEKHEKRLSELMEPASLLIDEAMDLVEDGNAQAAIEKYRKALSELDQVELENRERSKSPEFATLRNKRAYVNAAIDSLLLGQVKSNAKTVGVTDTRELEKKLAAEREAVKKAKEIKAKLPNDKRSQALHYIEIGDYITAWNVVSEMLKENASSPSALNLKAAIEAEQGKLEEARRTLYQAITMNEDSYYAYYNMADLILKINEEDTETAKQFYETGRAKGGPEVKRLEELCQ